MECERIIEKVQVHAFSRIQSAETAHGCRISLPLLEPNGDSITVAVERGPRSGTIASLTVAVSTGSCLSRARPLPLLQTGVW